jgi:hypothetical protein
VYIGWDRLDVIYFNVKTVWILPDSPFICSEFNLFLLLFYIVSLKKMNTRIRFEIALEISIFACILRSFYILNSTGRVHNCVAPLYVATPLNVALPLNVAPIPLNVATAAKCRKSFAVKCRNVNVKCRTNFRYR